MRTIVMSVDNTVCLATYQDDPGMVYLRFDGHEGEFRCISTDEFVRMVRTIVASQQ